MIEGYQQDITYRDKNTKPNKDGVSPMVIPGRELHGEEDSWLRGTIPGLCYGITESMSGEAEKREILFTNQRGGFFPPYILDLHI